MIQTMDLGLLIDVAAIILSIAAIVLTVVGFFASLRFYRDGVELQARVRELLSRVDERVSSVQTQVGGMFERTLEAVIGRSSAQAAAHEQKRLMQAAGDQGTAEPEPEDDVDPDLAKTVLDYFAFRKLRYTDVATGDARSVFMLGAGYGFNLFDSPSEIVFFGYFHELSPREIVARVRFLLGNIESAYKKMEEAEGDVRETARRLLDIMRIEVLVPEDSDDGRIAAAIEAYQTIAKRVPVQVSKPSSIREAVAEEYEQMDL